MQERATGTSDWRERGHVHPPTQARSQAGFGLFAKEEEEEADEESISLGRRGGRHLETPPLPRLPASHATTAGCRAILRFHT